ncbi:MAG: C40 family peptidase [Gemmatimonadales bacterium]
MRRRTDLALLLACLPTGLAAQGRDVDLFYGRWYQGNRAATYELRTDAPLTGALSHGFAVQVLVHDSLGRRRAFYGAGWELHALRRRATLGPYVIAGVTLGLSTDTADQALAALWNVGGGVEWRPLWWLALGAEARYRLEDRGPRGFWRPDDVRDGVSFALGTSIHWGAGSQERRAGSNRGGGGRRSPPSVPLMIVGSAGDVVRTAVDALGRPYQWGGTAENGFDCSGLIQYAYGRHGIRLPRMSRDQALAGSEVPPVVQALQPGDILLFSAHPGGGVTHVGMYVGEQTFIHSSSTGVKLSRLEVHDPDGTWWLTRWVGARRVMP